MFSKEFDDAFIKLCFLYTQGKWIEQNSWIKKLLEFEDYSAFHNVSFFIMKKEKELNRRVDSNSLKYYLPFNAIFQRIQFKIRFFSRTELT